MCDTKTKLYTENGEYVGTLEEIIGEYNIMAMEMIEDEFEKRKAEICKVDYDAECPLILTRYVDGCKKCICEEYCNSYEKEA